VLPARPVVVLEESSASEFHCFTCVVENCTGVNNIVTAFVSDELICLLFTLPEKISSFFELIMRKLGEVSGGHDWQAIVGDILSEFRVTKEEGAHCRLVVMQLFEDLLCINEVLYWCIVYYYEPCPT